MPIDLAMTMTVRNEERFLAANLEWHYHVGVRRAYIFLDRCTDGSERIAQSFPWVETWQSDRPASCRHMSEHQEQNARKGLEAARRDGVKWLLHLDADEFACGGEDPAAPVTDGLASLVAAAGPGTDMIVLRPREAIPVRTDLDDVFRTHVFFQDGAILDRDLLDPTTGLIRRLDKLIGHKEGKAIVRVDAPVEPRGSHRWRSTERRRLPREFAGFHYHFVLTSGAHFREKFGKVTTEPDTHRNGEAVPFPKTAFRQAAISMMTAEVDQYYRDWVALDAAELEQLVESGLAIKDPRVQWALGDTKRFPGSSG